MQFIWLATSELKSHIRGHFDNNKSIPQKVCQLLCDLFVAFDEIIDTLLKQLIIILFLIKRQSITMFDQAQITRKSMVLTNHSPLRLNSRSLPTLQSSDLPQLPKLTKKQQKPLKVFSIKTREELINEERFKNLLKLKINLNQLHIQELQFQQRMRPKNQRDANMAERMEVRLNQIMAMQTQPSLSPQRAIRDLEQIQFVQCCDGLLKVCQLVRREGNMHFKNKIANFTYSMKNQTQLLALFDKLMQDASPGKLYKQYRKLYQDSPHFKKELNALAIQSRHIVEVYEKSRYKFLNEDIIRRTNEMAAQGKEITGKLNHIQNWRMRKGLYKSLQKMQFECMANRNLYEQLTQRVKSMNI